MRFQRDKSETASRQNAGIWHFVCIVAVNGVNSNTFTEATSGTA